MKKSALFLVLMIAALPVFSQEKEGYSTDLGRKTTFVKNGFWDNWFIGAGAGANVYFGDHDANAKFMDRITVTPNFQLGTWFSPYYGARVKVSGLTNIHTFNNDASTMSRNKYLTTELNFMWNVTDYLMKYNSKRVYSFIPYVGMGWARGWDYKNNPYENDKTVNGMTLDLGIINQFRFSDRLALQLELSAKTLRDDFDKRQETKHRFDILGTASASLVYTLGKPTFAEATLRDQSEIDDLNNKINAQRAEIQRLANQPAPKPEVVVKEVVKKEVVEKGNEPVNNVVLFRINQTKIDPQQEVNVYNVAQYLKNNTDMKVRIVGYTDKATGTAAINERLSRERAQNVASAMIDKYGISKDRVIVDWKGQTEPPFGVTEWNRAVIMYLEVVE